MSAAQSPPKPKGALDAKRQAFSTLWDAMAIGKTEQFDPDRTRTMRPSTDLASLDATLLLNELPWLTQNQARVEFAEIRLGELLGKGGMGQINRAHQRSVAREVAVKSLYETTDPEAILTLLREGWITGRLEHPNIVPIYTLGRGDDGQPLIVMKKIAGVSLADLIHEPMTTRSTPNSPGFASGRCTPSPSSASPRPTPGDSPEPPRFAAHRRAIPCPAGQPARDGRRGTGRGRHG